MKPSGRDVAFAFAPIKTNHYSGAAAKIISFGTNTVSRKL